MKFSKKVLHIIRLFCENIDVEEVYVVSSVRLMDLDMLDGDM